MFFMPRSAEVLAATVNTSATGALVTQVFVPRSTQSPASWASPFVMAPRVPWIEKR